MDADISVEKPTFIGMQIAAIDSYPRQRGLANPIPKRLTGIHSPHNTLNVEKSEEMSALRKIE